MTDDAKVSLEPTDKWVQAGADSPMTSTSKLEDELSMKPIRAGDAEVPYVHFTLGAQSWRSDTERLDEEEVLGCSLTPCVSCDDDP